MSAQARPLTLREGVPLCIALMHAFLERESIRHLAIKGPAFVALAVRPPRPSSDVDILVDPARFDDARAALSAMGWQPWLVDSPDDPHAFHSATFLHSDWPCTLDLHHRFPGILAPAQGAFEVLWQQRTEVAIAHRDIPTTSRPAALAIEVLHQLRGCAPSRAGGVTDRVIGAMPRALDEEELASFESLIPRLGATYTLREAMQQFGLQVPDGEPLLEDSLQRAQWLRIERMGSRGTGWIGLLHWRHPLRSARALSQHALLDEASARRWAQSQGLPYRGRALVLGARTGRALGAVGRGLSAR